MQKKLDQILKSIKATSKGAFDMNTLLYDLTRFYYQDFCSLEIDCVVGENHLGLGRGEHNFVINLPYIRLLEELSGHKSFCANGNFTLDLGKIGIDDTTENTSHLLTIPIHDMKRIKLSDSQDFSNLFMDGDLVEAQGVLENAARYLGFRNKYEGDKRFDRNVPDGEDWTQGVRMRLNNTYIPLYNMEVDSQYTMINGFALKKTKSGFLLYEFNDVELPESLRRESIHGFGDTLVARTYGIWLHDRCGHDGITVHKDWNAVKRLYERMMTKRMKAE